MAGTNQCGCNVRQNIFGNNPSCSCMNGGSNRNPGMNGPMMPGTVPGGGMQTNMPGNMDGMRPGRGGMQPGTRDMRPGQPGMSVSQPGAYGMRPGQNDMMMGTGNMPGPMNGNMPGPGGMQPGMNGMGGMPGNMYNMQNGMNPANGGMIGMQAQASGNDMNSMQQGRCQLARQVDAAGFVLDEINLFLDTHPDNREAFRYFKDVAAMRQNAVNAYESQYGPLTAGAATGESWNWVTEKWPWEGDC